VTWATTWRDYAGSKPKGRFEAIHDGSLWSKGRLILMLAEVSRLVLRIRPEVVVSTGAAPGYFALRAGKALGARTVWIDSLANAGELSLSGRMVSKHADLWLTQWEHLERPEGPRFLGSVL